MVGALRQNSAARVRLVRRRGHAARSIGFHERAPVRLLVVGDAHHEDLHVDAEERARVRERRSPLPRPGLRRDPPDARLPVVESLCDRGVRLVAAGRAHALVLVVDLRRRIERLLQAARAVQRARAPVAIDVAHRLGDLDVALGRDLLHDERHREQRREVVGSHRLHRARVKDRRRRRRQVGNQVVPALGQTGFVEYVLDWLAHGLNPQVYQAPADLTK